MPKTKWGVESNRKVVSTRWDVWGERANGRGRLRDLKNVADFGKEGEVIRLRKEKEKVRMRKIELRSWGGESKKGNSTG